MNPRAYIRLDRFGWLQIAQRHRLTSAEVVVLLALTCMADFRSQTWTGTVTDLAAELRLQRRAASTALKRLDTEGLTMTESPFGGNRVGRVRVELYDQLVCGSSPKSSPKDAPDSRPSRAQVAPETRQEARATRENRGSVGIAGEMEQGMCLHCQQPIQGHPFNDHEPLAAAVSHHADAADEATALVLATFPGAVEVPEGSGR